MNWVDLNEVETCFSISTDLLEFTRLTSIIVIPSSLAGVLSRAQESYRMLQVRAVRATYAGASLRHDTASMGLVVEVQDVRTTAFGADNPDVAERTYPG